MSTLPAAGIGAPGMIGVDGLENKSITLDFRAQALRIEAADRLWPDSREIIVAARRRDGQLTLVDADLAGIPIVAFIDSGAQNTIAAEMANLPELRVASLRLPKLAGRFRRPAHLPDGTSSTNRRFYLESTCSAASRLCVSISVATKCDFGCLPSREPRFLNDPDQISFENTSFPASRAGTRPAYRHEHTSLRDGRRSARHLLSCAEASLSELLRPDLRPEPSVHAGNL